jgi:glycosyltransferase involved in cell wall biosynthesis
VVRSGIALRDTPPEAETRRLRERLGISPHEPVLGIVAHVLPHKGYDDLIQALALLQEKLPRAKCLIVGRAPRARYLRKLLQRAERLSVRDRLIVVGFQEDVVPFLHAMDVFVLPSRTEGLPITILEAMAAGKPVVATAVGGIPEVVRDGETGLLAPPSDPGRLAEAVLRLLEAPTLAKAMGGAGRAWVERAFGLEQEAKQTCALYRQVLAASPSGSVRDHGAVLG